MRRGHCRGFAKKGEVSKNHGIAEAPEWRRLAEKIGYLVMFSAMWSLSRLCEEEGQGVKERFAELACCDILNNKMVSCAAGEQ